MSGRASAVCLLFCASITASAQRTSSSVSQPAAGLTIYNQDFALVRTPIQLSLQAGTTEISVTNVTGQLEPDSVVLRDPANSHPIHIVEQNYEGALRVQSQMLAKFEGQTIDFVVGTAENARIAPGKIIRAGFVPQFDLLQRYGQSYFYQQQQQNQQQEPLIEMEGKLRYGLPGVPLFPSATPGLTLHPTLRWTIASDRSANIAAELDYITGGLRWDASYNVLAPSGDVAADQSLEMVGWVNVTNESGTDFRDVSLQLMAGDISKLTNQNGMLAVNGRPMDSIVVAGVAGVQQQITQQNFDDYHLYDLHRSATLLDHESKQIEFLNVAGIPAKRVYVYDGFGTRNQNNYYQWNQPNFGGESNKKVWITQEFKNSEANHLGMPLPKGRMRFYRREANGNLQFVGENTIDHTPKDETIDVYLGNAFDLTGERTRTDFRNVRSNMITENYSVTVRSAKDTATPVRIVEHMYRTSTWEISQNSDPFEKKDSQTIQFNVNVPAHGEKTVNYLVTYTW